MSEFNAPLISPEDRVIVTIDATSDFSDLLYIKNDIGVDAHAFKLGQGMFMHDNPWRIHNMLKQSGVNTILDAKYEEDPDQMTPIIASAFERGADKVSVAPASGVSALISAAQAAPPGNRILAPLPNASPDILPYCLHNIIDTNKELEEDRAIKDIMCNVGYIKRVKDLGNFSVIATGIRLPEEEADDHPHISTPGQALKDGADYLAVGRSITRGRDYRLAFENVIKDIRESSF